MSSNSSPSLAGIAVKAFWISRMEPWIKSIVSPVDRTRAIRFMFGLVFTALAALWATLKSNRRLPFLSHIVGISNRDPLGNKKCNNLLDDAGTNSMKFSPSFADTEIDYSPENSNESIPNHIRQQHRLQHTSSAPITSSSHSKMPEEINEETYDRTHRRGSCGHATTYPNANVPSIDFVPPSYKKTPEEREIALALVQQCFWFSDISLTEAEQEVVVAGLRRKELAPGTIVVRENVPSQFFFLIERGVFVCYKTTDEGETVECYRYVDQGYFGELGMLSSTASPKTWRVSFETPTGGVVWYLDADTFKYVVMQGKTSLPDCPHVRRAYEGCSAVEALTEEEVESVMGGVWI